DVMDLVFAVDSIPAVLAITQDTFIVYTSNVCAILGLRSLYFLLANLVSRFVYLRLGLAIVLCLVGLKMIGAHLLPVPTWISLVGSAGNDGEDQYRRRQRRRRRLWRHSRDRTRLCPVRGRLL